MDKQVVFKSVLNGFDKHAVLQYIDELHSKLDKSERELEQRQEEWYNEKDSMDDKNAALETTVCELQKALEEAYAGKQDDSDAVNELKKQINKMTVENEDKEHELIMLREQNRLYREEVSAIQEKSKKYDEAAASIGDVILDARNDAKRIVAEAQLQADSIIAEAQRKADKIALDTENSLILTQKKVDQLRGQFLSIRDQMNDSVTLLNAHFEKVESSINSIDKFDATQYFSSVVSEAEVAAEPVLEETVEEPAVAAEEIIAEKAADVTTVKEAAEEKHIAETVVKEENKEAKKEEVKTNPLKAILEQASAAQKKNGSFMDKANQWQNFHDIVKNTVMDSLNKIDEVE